MLVMHGRRQMCQVQVLCSLIAQFWLVIILMTMCDRPFNTTQHTGIKDTHMHIHQHKTVIWRTSNTRRKWTLWLRRKIFSRWHILRPEGQIVTRRVAQWAKRARQRSASPRATSWRQKIGNATDYIKPPCRKENNSLKLGLFFLFLCIFLDFLIKRK